MWSTGFEHVDQADAVHDTDCVVKRRLMQGREAVCLISGPLDRLTSDHPYAPTPVDSSGIEINRTLYSTVQYSTYGCSPLAPRAYCRVPPMRRCYFSTTGLVQNCRTLQTTPKPGSHMISCSGRRRWLEVVCTLALPSQAEYFCAWTQFPMIIYMCTCTRNEWTTF